MLEGIFGNRTAEKVLLHLFSHGETHASAVAADLSVALHPVRRQLMRFERAGVLVSRTAGRTRLYAFNPKSSLVRPLREILRIAYESIPPGERRRLLGRRRRPRRSGKPVL